MIKVLIVDDDKLARKGIISLLHEGQYNMQVVGDVQNGKAALRFLEKETADLVFADIDMPEMTGLELMQICKDRYPDLKFVVLTFYEEFPYVRQALRLGALDYISKLRMEMEDCDSLLNRIRQMMEDRGFKSDAEGNRAAEDAETVLPDDWWKEITDEWKKMYWIYDEDAYQILCKSMKENKVTVRRMEHLAVRLIQTVEIETGRESTLIPVFEEEKNLYEWLNGWRKELSQWALVQESLDKTSVCIMKAVVYIRNHINLPLHTEEIGGLVGMSRSYFSVNFKKLTGRNYHDFVRKERIKYAKKLLADTDKGINEIAAAAGYEDVNYFNRVFLEEAGCTPNQFRKKCFQYSEQFFCKE